MNKKLTDDWFAMYVGLVLVAMILAGILKDIP
jgi:hypothetical protein